MEEKDLINAFLSFQSYKRVFINPFYEIVKELLEKEGDKKALKFVKRQEEVRTELLNEVNSYKNKYDTITSDEFITTREKENKLDSLKKLRKELTDKVQLYYENWSGFYSKTLLPLLKAWRQLLDKEKHKSEVFDFIEELAEFFVIGSSRQRAESFVTEQLKGRYELRPVNQNQKDKNYYISNGYGLHYQKAIEKELSRYNLDIEVVGWYDILFEMLVETKQIKDNYESYIRYISKLVDDQIEADEQEEIKVKKLISSMPASKMETIKNFFGIKK